ncbi:MAG TPA: DUF1800 domain-containing protein [Tepidisphaeraceae bacterium]|jgi:uncharacterized protein (DUF1800 family)
MSRGIAAPADAFAPFVPTEEQPFGAQRLGHLLRRTTFGATPERLSKFAGKSPADVIDWLFDFDPEEDPFQQFVDQLEGFVNLNQSQSVASYWYYRMLNSPQPLQERLALFWHGHFATGAGKVERGRLMHQQIQLFRQKGPGSFRDLLIAVGRDPAMLIWLDGQANRKGKPNENYAREVMELFTLGIGNYSEKDIKELARAFTGWRVQEEEAKFDPKQFDDGEKELLGATGKFNSESAADVLLKQPACSRFISSKLLREFVHPEPEPVHVDRYARRLVDTKWNIKTVLREMLASRLFFSDWSYRSRIKSPIELAVGAAQVVGGKVDANFLRESCTRMGQNLLNPPNVKGWPGNEDWINANTVMLRFNFAMQITSQRQQEFVRKTDFDKWLKQTGVKTADDVVNYYAKLMLDGKLDDDAKEKLLDFMDRGPKGEKKSFVLTSETVNTKVKGLLHLMMAMPQYQLA